MFSVLVMLQLHTCKHKSNIWEGRNSWNSLVLVLSLGPAFEIICLVVFFMGVLISSRSQMVKNPYLLFTFRNGGLDSLIKVTGMGFLSEERGGRPVLGTIFQWFFSLIVISTLYTSSLLGFVLWRMASTSTVILSYVCTERWLLLHRFTSMI